MESPDAIITALGLRPLPVEGGLWTQTWRDERCTAIYYLLIAPEFAALHRLPHLEMYAHHAGAPARLTLLNADGTVSHRELGSDVAQGQRPQVVVPAGTWQGCRTLGKWSLLGTIVVPPYSDDIVEFGDGEALARAYPAGVDEIRGLCR